MPASACVSRLAIACCGFLLLLFAALSWFALQTKSPVYDEPYHAISAWVQLRFDDFRIDDEDPPLWQYWASIPNRRQALKADFNSSTWRSIPNQEINQWLWGVQTLYLTPGNDPMRLINRCRAMMLILAIGCGAMIGFWSWRIGRAVAAIVAVALFTLDPNFLAHSSLMKNDVVFAMSMFALVFALWKAGQQLTAVRIATVALLSVVTLTVKFSGCVAVLLVPLLLLIRAILPFPWAGFGKSFSSKKSRLAAAIGITCIAVVVSYAGIWLIYGLRFRPTPGPNVWLNLTELTDQVRKNQMILAFHGSPPPGATPGPELTLAARAALFANRHALLPQAFIGGFLFTYSSAMVRLGFLNGQISSTGWWWYFPFAMLVKTPIATLLAVAITAVICVRTLAQRRIFHFEFHWTAICLAIPVIIFLGSAMVSNLNIGLRHVLGIYPFAYVAIGATAARFWQRRHRRAQTIVIALGLMLWIESWWAYPNYLAYFNVIATRLPGGKLQLLGDSNLDWGQDLPLLAQWQHEHPKETLYLSYFGYANPAYYGIKYIPLPGGYHYDPPPHEMDLYSRCYVAISVSNLQGLVPPELSSYYARWRQQKPVAVLGDTIYLYRYDPVENLRKKAGR